MVKKKTVASTAADPLKKFAKLELDGETYSLIYDYNAIALAEMATGTNLLIGLRSLANLGAGQLRGLLLAALSVAHPEMTPLRVGQMIRVDTIEPILLALAQAYENSLPEVKKSDPTVPEATLAEN